MIRFIKVNCELPSGVTTYGKSKWISVGHCDSIGCFSHQVPYEDNVLPQIQSLIDTSSSCSQSITFKCKLAAWKVSK